MFFCDFTVGNQTINKKTITLVATANLMEFFFILNEFCNYFELERKNRSAKGKGTTWEKTLLSKLE